MVYTEPKIKDFISFSKNLYNTDAINNSGNIYFIKYKENNFRLFPRHIHNLYKTNVKDHIDGKIIYLNKKQPNDCIILYGKNKFKKISIEFGAYIGNKIDLGHWNINTKVSKIQLYNFALGWGLEQYKFNSTKVSKTLGIPKGSKYLELIYKLSGIFYGKELINIPSIDMGPDALEKSFINFCEYNQADYKIFKNNTIKNDFPLIYAVGKSSIEGPRLLELNWGTVSSPKVILVGKGVCFDTGGLDLKPSQYMRNMKKDMGGAASVLSLAHFIIMSGLKINLKVLIPAVNNDIGPPAMRPGDVYNSRAGITVEIGNTDAEGRLILADTLHYADSFKPNLLIDFATLTGAARVALGPDIPAYFTHQEDIASMLQNTSIDEKDFLWRLPLYSPYSSWLESEVADTNNISQGSHAGSITATLFLDKFVKSTTKWIHIDTYAWSDINKPGRTKGGDILGVRSIFKFLKDYINNL